MGYIKISTFNIRIETTLTQCLIILLKFFTRVLICFNEKLDMSLQLGVYYCDINGFIKKN